MGSLCSKGASSTDGNGHMPNRRVTNATYDPPRTLGSGSNISTTMSGDPQEAKRKAAEAAEARAAAAKQQQRGKLATNLQQQKKQSRAAILDSLSKDEQRARALDESLETQKYQ
ncbi:hypothetical protein HI914_01828 [Erysiphe necator]|nr:hypothetical protein HI914_01828 [Erysiphe necator]